MPAVQILEMAMEVLIDKLKNLTDMLLKTKQASAALGNVIPTQHGGHFNPDQQQSGGLLDLM